MGGSPSSTAPSYDPAEEYRKGIAALEAKDYKTAKKAFDHVLSVAPKDANTNMLAGMSRAGLEDWKGATKFYEKAVKIDPELILAQGELGVAYAKTADTAKAEAVRSGLQAKATACADTCPQAAALKSALAKISDALAPGTAAALADRPNLMFASEAQGDSQYLAAVSLINEHRYEDAITTLHEAQATFGPHPDILTYLGFANRKLQRFDVAESYYKQALAVAPNHRGATEYYGELKVERGDMTGAKAMLAALDRQCRFGCPEAEELRLWIDAGRSPHSS